MRRDRLVSCSIVVIPQSIRAEVLAERRRTGITCIQSIEEEIRGNFKCHQFHILLESGDTVRQVVDHTTCEAHPHQAHIL